MMADLIKTFMSSSLGFPAIASAAGMFHPWMHPAAASWGSLGCGPSQCLVSYLLGFITGVDHGFFQQTKPYDDVRCLIDCFIIANWFHDWKCFIDYPQHIKNSEGNCSIAPWTFHNKNKLKRLQASAERQESRTNTTKKHISEMCTWAAFKTLLTFHYTDWLVCRDPYVGSI